MYLLHEMEDERMNLKDVKEIAVDRGIKAGKMKKGELIRVIQEAEGNPACFETGRNLSCNEFNCLWKEDCK